MFDFLSPFYWIKTILGLILTIALILLPGWKAIVSENGFSCLTQMLIKNFPGTFGTAVQISISYYKSWFEKEGQKKFKEFQEKALKNLEEKANIKLENK